ncbi:cupin domain-containing protein [Paraburkholderia ribeironis]|nr:cupin domain-containing protein [Paraburkholderia ribeironis]
MSTEIATQFSHVRPQDTPYADQGLRDFFVYRDLGIAQATGGKVRAQLVKAIRAPEQGTSWHRHEADFHIVIMLTGWGRFMYGDKETLVAAGDCVHQEPGIVHYLFDYSREMEYIEIVSPVDFKSIEIEGLCDVPALTPWDSVTT